MYKRIAFAGDVLSGKEVLLAAEGIAVDLSFHRIFPAGSPLIH